MGNNLFEHIILYTLKVQDTYKVILPSSIPFAMHHVHLAFHFCQNKVLENADLQVSNE
jgi:hypothetical protein